MTGLGGNEEIQDSDRAAGDGLPLGVRLAIALWVVALAGAAACWVAGG